MNDTIQEPLTVMVKGKITLAKLYKGEPSALTYSNRKQAYAKAAQLGSDWGVYCFGRPFYVCKH